MKKIVAMMLALMLVLVSVSAMAADPTYTPYTPGTEAVTISGFEKDYEVTGATGDTSIFPAENLTFTVNAPSDNPDGGSVKISDVKLKETVNVQKSSEDTEKSYTLSFKHGAYTKPGIYHYELTEANSNTQGVEYDTEKLYVSVLVGFKEVTPATNPPTYTTALDVLGIGITLKDSTRTGQDVNHLTEDKDKTTTTTKKDDTINNKYNLGTLDVTKKVTGNWGDKNTPFTMVVTFNTEAGKEVRSAITITTDAKSTSESGTSIAASAWTYTGTGDSKKGTATATITIKDGGHVTFKDVPAGVTYTIVEDESHTADDPTMNDPTSGYTVSYSNDVDETAGTIVKDTTKNETVTNDKNMVPDTGIALDTVPYLMIMAIALMGVAMMIVRRREEM